MSRVWRYVPTPGVSVVALTDRPGWRTPQDGRIAGDDALVALWRAPESADVDDETTRAALTCLAEAGLLTRDGLETAPVAPPAVARTGPTVSVVLVTYDSDAWIDECLASLRQQTYGPLEVIVVDNGSPRDPEAAVRRAHPDARYLRQPSGRSFASALNAGAALAQGDALFFVNPDVALEPDAVAHLAAGLRAGPRVGAVAAKLRFHWAPAFLNGLGNRVEDHSWGSDNAIGHLDLGQFDDRPTVPSACFAAALLSRDAWRDVGPVDEGFPMYYEDVAWCYRARRLGWQIAAAPHAIVYHAFGSRLATGDEAGLTPRKLANVVYGRLRFTETVLDGPARGRFRRAYLREDLGNYRHYRRARDRASAGAYRRAWIRALRHAPGWWRASRRLTSRATVSADALLQADAAWPRALVWNGVPELTTAIVREVYLPLLMDGRGRRTPEWPRA